MKTPPLIGTYLGEVYAEATRLGLTVGDYLAGKSHAAGWEGLHDRILRQHGGEDPPMILVHLPWGNPAAGHYAVDQRDRCTPEEQESVSYGIAALANRYRTSDIGIYDGAPYRTIPAKKFVARDVARWCADSLHHKRRIPVFDASNNSAPGTPAGKRVDYARLSQPDRRTMREALPLLFVPPGVGVEAGVVGTSLYYHCDPKCDWLCDIIEFWKNEPYFGDGLLVPPDEVKGRIWIFERWLRDGVALPAIKLEHYDLLIRAFKAGFSIMPQPPWQGQAYMTAAQIRAAAGA